jgi:hypothetical protein
MSKFTQILCGIFLKSKKKANLSINKINGINILFNQQHDKVIRDYYLYCVNLISRQIDHIDCRCNIIFGKYSFQFSNSYPTINIDFQIEHTLVKPGGRSSDEAKAGVVPVAGLNETNYLVRIANFAYLNNLDVVIEYSRPNFINIEKCGEYKAFTEKLFILAPLLYDTEIGLASTKRNFEVITLFGNPNEPRRRSFLNYLESSGVKFRNINNYFNEIDHLYRNIKILINIRQTDHHDTLEELRILPALRCGTIVICEDAPLRDATGYSQFILWSSLEDMPDLIKDVLNNYDAYHQRIFGGETFTRRMKRLEFRNKIIANRIAARVKLIALSS